MMSEDKFELTNRGFKMFSTNVNKEGDELKLIESSGVGRPKLRMVAKDYHRAPEATYSSCITLDVEEVKQLIIALQNFVDDAESPENWRNDPDYKKTWWE